jgi:hypothetical protein
MLLEKNMPFYFQKKSRIKILSIFFICAELLTLSCLSTNKQKDSSIKEVLKNFKGEPVIPREANKIIIPVFNNFTNQPSISLKLNAKLKEQITSDGRLAVVAENDTADLLLNGMIKAYQVQPLKFNGFDKPIQKRLRIIASIKLFDIKKEKEIFFDGYIQAFEEFSDVIPPITSEIQIQDKVLDDLAKRIALKIINGWYTILMTPIEKGK